MAASLPGNGAVRIPTRFLDLSYYDPIFGLDFIYAMYKGLKSHTALERMQARFDRSGASTSEVAFSLEGTLFATIEPENLKSILSLRFKDWGLVNERKQVMIPFLGEGILETDGDKWQHSRDMLRPNFAKTQTGDLEMFESHFQPLLQAIPRDGQRVDLQELFFKFTLDTATEFLFSESVFTLQPGSSNQEANEFVRAFTYCQNSIEGQSDDWGFLALFITNPRLKKQYKIVHDFVDTLIEKAKASRERYEKEKEHSNRRIFIYELFNQTTNAAKIRAKSLNILLAGHDTTTSLLSNVWFELSRRPAVYARLRAEIDTLNNEIPTFVQIKSLKYLRALLNESLRLYHVVPENSRLAVCDIVLPVGGGPDGKSLIFVAKGQLAYWSVWTMHRRKDLYGEDAEEFRPERWLDDEVSGEKGLRVGWEYLPFNGGPRTCLGQQFALTEASYVTVRLMQEFSGIQSKDSEPWREKLILTCVGLGGCKIVLTPRE